MIMSDFESLMNMYEYDAQLYGSHSEGARMRAEAQERRAQQLTDSKEWFRQNGINGEGFDAEIANARALAERYRLDAGILSAKGK